jgi:hypothetical protein
MFNTRVQRCCTSQVLKSVRTPASVSVSVYLTILCFRSWYAAISNIRETLMCRQRIRQSGVVHAATEPVSQSPRHECRVPSVLAVWHLKNSAMTCKHCKPKTTGWPVSTLTQQCLATASLHTQIFKLIACSVHAPTTCLWTASQFSLNMCELETR